MVKHVFVNRKAMYSFEKCNIEKHCQQFNICEGYENYCSICQYDRSIFCDLSDISL